MRRKMTNLRLLAGIRQSVTDDKVAARQDPHTSPRRQLQTIEGYAGTHGHTVAMVAEDLDTSGAVPPQDRADLGKKLLRLDEYDAVIFTKFDRLGRSLIDFVNFMQWLDERGKYLIILDPPLDLTNDFGRAVAAILMVIAELERKMIRQRVLDGYESRTRAGRYSGKQFPFGLEPVALSWHPNGSPASWGFQESEKYGPVVRKIIDMILAGKSLGAVVRYLNAEAIPTPRDAVREYYNRPLVGSEWRATSVTKILMSDAILGVVVMDGEVLHDSTGLAVVRCEPIVDRDKLMRVRKILKANADRTGPRINSSPLLQVAFCIFCGGPHYVTRTTWRDKVYRYYGCAVANRDSTKCPGKRIDADWLESWLMEKLLAERGPFELTEVRTKEPTDYSEAMAAMAGAIGHLSSEIALGRARGEDVSALEATRAEREDDLTHLAGLADDPTNKGPRTIVVKTGETWAQRLERLQGDDSELNVFLRSKGIRVAAGRRADETEPTAVLRSGWSDDVEADYLPVAPV